MSKPVLVDQCKSCGLTIQYFSGDRGDESWCVRGTLCANKKVCRWLVEGPALVEVRIGK